MADLFDSNNLSKAEEHVKNALSLKQQKNLEAALTEFRRAVLINPNLFEAQYEIGLLCREKAKTDPLFQRYAFEAFQKAARLNLQHEDAHVQYIMANQKQGRFEELLLEYDKWIKENPDNELLKKCRKNVLTISMAMMPSEVKIASSGMEALLKKSLLFLSMGSIIFGFVFFLSPLMFKRMNRPITQEQAKRVVFFGMLLEAAGIAGFIVRGRIK